VTTNYFGLYIGHFSYTGVNRGGKRVWGELSLVTNAADPGAAAEQFMDLLEAWSASQLQRAEPRGSGAEDPEHHVPAAISRNAGTTRDQAVLLWAAPVHANVVCKTIMEIRSVPAGGFVEFYQRFPGDPPEFSLTATGLGAGEDDVAAYGWAEDEGPGPQAVPVFMQLGDGDPDYDPATRSYKGRRNRKKAAEEGSN
jgi:hypothetical protein